ncbi:rRNA maturation RNase YbeY [Mesonia aquimarina]|uniref:rRNA maturation RNase YbeY n=1 Tax=Mesonia aquimarina TaxID=1504967 RepID=UPI000EF5D0A1|nr:rRNA maturation RNase YbeY [Mesonia aquimarina]
MINFFSETNFNLDSSQNFEDWITKVISSESKNLGDINYIFCDDEYLHEINLKYLQHDTLTDIITFDSVEGDIINADIFISIDRVNDNAKDLNINFNEELKRVMIHGILHLCGFSDHSTEEKQIMREKENEKIKMFHVEQ